MNTTSIASLGLTAIALGCVTPEAPEARAHRLEERAKQDAARKVADAERRLAGKGVPAHLWCFHDFSTAPTNATFCIWHASHGFVGTPRERHLSDHLTALLHDRGWQLAQPAVADFVVSIHHQMIDKDITTTRQIPQSTGGHYSGTVYTPAGPRFYSGYSSGPIQWRSQVETSTLTGSHLEVSIHDIRNHRRPEDSAKIPVIYQGIVRAASFDGVDTHTLLPGMLNVLFKDFPGQSGDSLDVKVHPAFARKSIEH